MSYTQQQGEGNSLCGSDKTKWEASKAAPGRKNNRNSHLPTALPSQISDKKLLEGIGRTSNEHKEH